MQYRLILKNLGILSVALFSVNAYARGGGFNSLALREDNSMVTNGHGISSPSFWNGITGANPAGLIDNLDFKIQGSAASFDDSTRNLRESAGIYGGNGLIAGGLNYSTYNSSPYPSGESEIDFGLALNLETLQTTIGISGSHASAGGMGAYDIGALINLSTALRFGAEIPDFTHGLHVLAGGFTYSADPMVDFVVDAGYQLQNRDGIIKPGISLHTAIIQATAAYGFRFTGTSDDVLVTTKFTAGLGLKLAEKLLVEYEYRGLPEHRLGLTLRFN